jgi:di- and tripeptidase
MACEGTFLYAGRLEGGLDVWDLDTCQLIRTVKAHEADVLTVAVSPEIIFAGGSNGWAKVKAEDLLPSSCR